MNAITHELEGLWDKENLLFFSFGGAVDFKESSIVVETYFDDPKQTKSRFFAAVWVIEKEQKNTTIMRVPIPRDAHNAIVLLTSGSAEDDLKKVLVFSEEYVPGEMKNKFV